MSEWSKETIFLRQFELDFFLSYRCCYYDSAFENISLVSHNDNDEVTLLIKASRINHLMEISRDPSLAMEFMQNHHEWNITSLTNTSLKAVSVINLWIVWGKNNSKQSVMKSCHEKFFFALTENKSATNRRSMSGLIVYPDYNPLHELFALALNSRLNYSSEFAIDSCFGTLKVFPPTPVVASSVAARSSVNWVTDVLSRTSSNNEKSLWVVTNAPHCCSNEKWDEKQPAFGFSQSFSLVCVQPLIEAVAFGIQFQTR